MSKVTLHAYTMIAMNRSADCADDCAIVCKSQLWLAVC